MNQERQARGRGNAPRQAPAPRRDDRPATENEQISRDQSAQKRMQALFQLIRDRRGEVEAVLPPDVPYLKFEAVVNMAIRREPKLLECYAPSFIKACIQAAYDGLLPDGNQAVILYSNNKVPGTGENGTKAEYRLEARYQSMVYGLRLKLVQAGAVTFIDAIVRFAKEPFRYRRGLDPVLDHEPILDPAQRGDPTAVYAVATLPDGTKVFDVLNKQEVMAAREVAKTKNVWDGPFGLEMWKKTAIRRLSKAIPTTRPMRDAEALEMFPQFADAGDQRALPAPARPQRADFRPALERPGAELPLDLGAFEGGYDTEESRRATQAARDAEQSESRKQSEPATDDNRSAGGETAGGGKKGKSEPKKVAETSENRKETGGDGAGKDDQRPVQAEPPMPRTADQWTAWAGILVSGLEKLPDSDAVHAEHDRNRRLIDAAPEEIRREVVAAMQDRITDLVAPEPQQQSLGIEGE